MRATGTLPASWYREPAVYETERREVFGREWLVFARADALGAPGSYVAGVLAGYPLVVLRDDAGDLRGFHNVCRHRAGPLVGDGAGTCRGGLVCRYHGWSYRQDGSLLRARDFGDDDDLDVAQYGLWPVQIATWAGLVWVNLDESAPVFEADLGVILHETDDVPLDAYRFRAERTEDLACNWKTYVDNYLEGYHIPLVHPTLMREVDASQYRVETRDRYCIHSAPARDGASNAGRWLWRWPNVALNVFTNGMNVERILPLAHDRTRVVYTYFFVDADETTVDAAMRVAVTTLAEDRAICEAVQRNLDAGVYDTGRLSPKHEGGVQQFHDLVRTAVLR
jgi:phenylpropionate dioxygenase-like ring-hydroxylating dioxygenase large terminal subunit